MIVNFSENIIPLSCLKKGETGFIHKINEPSTQLNMSYAEFEKRFLEMGLLEGTPVTVIHEGPVGQDPLAVRLRVCQTVALRRREADCILVKKNASEVATTHD